MAQQPNVENEAKDEVVQPQPPVVGRWTIGDVLSKDQNTWVHRGQDIKTGKIVILKFIEKADDSWATGQAKQVEAYILSITQIQSNSNGN